MDRELNQEQRAKYEAWLGTITTPKSDETLIAWKLAALMGLHPTKTIRATRGQRGQEDIVARVETAVADDPALRFWQDGRVRRVRFSTSH